MVRALTPTLAVQPPHVCHRPEAGLSSLARTCSSKWIFLWRLHLQAQRFPLLETVLTSGTSIQKIGDGVHKDMAVLGSCCTECLNAPPGVKQATVTNNPEGPRKTTDRRTGLESPTRSRHSSPRIPPTRRSPLRKNRVQLSNGFSAV